MRIAIAYVATALCFLALDLVWLGMMTERFYRPRMGGLLLEQPSLAVAGLFYLAYVAGMQVFAVRPALREGGWRRALGLGAMLGAFAYATYDLTNLATLRGFPAAVAAVDIAWGIFATGIACALAAAITRRLARVQRPSGKSVGRGSAAGRREILGAPPAPERPAGPTRRTSRTDTQ